jgi:Tfp pilus assembly protein PilX
MSDPTNSTQLETLIAEAAAREVERKVEEERRKAEAANERYRNSQESLQTLIETHMGNTFLACGTFEPNVTGWAQFVIPTRLEYPVTLSIAGFFPQGTDVTVSCNRSTESYMLPHAPETGASDRLLLSIAEVIDQADPSSIPF